MLNKGINFPKQKQIRIQKIIRPYFEQNLSAHFVSKLPGMPNEKTIQKYFKEWTKEWEQQGMQKGMQQGLQEGRQVEGVLLLTKLLHRRFGSIPDDMQQRLAHASTEELETWAENLMDATTLEDVFICH